MELGQIDSYGGIYKPVDFSNTSRVSVEYDGNISNVYWGQWTSSYVAQNPTSFSTNYALMQGLKNGYGENASRFLMYNFGSNAAAPVSYVESKSTPALYGDYHFVNTYMDGQLSMTVTPIGSLNSIIYQGTLNAPTFDLQGMSYLGLFAGTTTGTPAYIDNVKITTTTTAPTCTPPLVLQGNVCVTLTGALPTPENFTNQALQFALNNNSVLTNIAAQYGNSAYQVAHSTQQQLNPQSSKYLKDLAKRKADDLEKGSVGVATEIAFLEALGKTGAKQQALSLMGSIANYFGFKLADEAAQQSGTWYGQRSVLLADLTTTVGNCVIDFATSLNKLRDLALCNANLIAFNVDNGLVPLLRLYAIDPPNPNFKAIVVVNLPPVTIADAELQATADALLAAQAYLGAVNETYDRYVSAYNAGDTESALLQLQAYLTFLDKYNGAVLKSKQGLAAVLSVLSTNPVDVNEVDLQALLAAMQEEINANGLDSESVAFLTGLGLDAAQILDVQNDILGFRYSPTGNLRDNLNGLFIGLDAVSVPNAVPEPTALLLFATAGFALIIVQRRRRTQTAQWH